MTQALGWARRPMLERIHLLPTALPITLIYGAESWIDTSTGRRVMELRPGSYVRHLVRHGGPGLGDLGVGVGMRSMGGPGGAV